MDPYRKAPKIETFKRSWLRKKLRKFRIRFLTFLRGKLRRVRCLGCNKRIPSRWTGMDYPSFLCCRKCGQLNVI